MLLHVPQILRWDPADWRFSRRFQSHQLPAYYSAEWQANYATGALLMPRRTLIPFTKSLAEGGDLLSEVARKYGVSHEAAETRLSKVGLTKANPRVGRGPWG